MPYHIGNSQFINYFCQINAKGIKKTIKILGFSAAGIVLFFALLFIALNNNAIQNFVAKSIVSSLSEKLHTKVRLGSVNYQLFNTLELSNLYVEDLQGDTLLHVSSAKASFEFWEFFQGKIIINSVRFDELYGNLVVDKNGKSNLDFVIKAFAKPSNNDTTKVIYRIDRFQLKNSRFNYSNLKQYKPLKAGVFNGNKLAFTNIETEVSLDLLTKDTLSLHIDKLSTNESSGLIITQLSTQVNGSKRGLIIPSLNIQMPNSNVLLEGIELKIDSLADLKNFNNKVRIKAPIRSSYIELADLSAFVPGFKNIHDIATIKGEVAGRISNLRLKKLDIKYGKSFLFNADLDVNGLPNLDEAFIYININDLRCEKNDVQDFISDLTQKPLVLPKELNKLGTIHYKGNISGFLSNLVAYGNLNTNMGNISTDFSVKLENQFKDFSYNGTIKSSKFQLGNLLHSKDLGNIAFHLNTTGSKPYQQGMKGKIKANIDEIQFKGYNYRDVAFVGQYNGNGFDGKVDIVDENIDAHFNGVIDMRKKLPVFDFELEASNINVYNLKLSKKYQGSSLSFNGKTNMVGNSLDNINGYVMFENVVFNNKNKTLYIPEIKFNSRTENNYTNFVINSTVLNGSVAGNFKYGTVKHTLNKLLKNYLPALASENEKQELNTNNVLNIDLSLENTKDITETLELPYSIDGKTTLKGYVNENTQKVELTGTIPSFKSGKSILKDINLHIENPKKNLQLTTRAKLQEKDKQVNLFLIAAAANDSLHTHLGWQSGQKVTNAGDIVTATHFAKAGNKMTAQMKILPTQIIILDSIWTLHKSTINFNADSTITVRNFRLDNNKQFLTIDGIASKKKTDQVAIEMNALNLDYVMTLVKLRGVSLGGMITGRANLFNVLQQPIFEANLAVKDFSINHKIVGDGKVNSNWDKVNSVLLAHGTFENEKADTIVVANAVYTPKVDSISVFYDAKNFSIAFLQPYLESVVQNVNGYFSGRIHMAGPLKTGVKFSGDGFLNKGQLSVKTLQTKYFLNDSVHLTTKTIEFRNIKVYDQEKNPAALYAMMRHNGYFQHMTYDARIKGNNILALNTQQTDNDYFYGKAYAKGTVHIYGDEKEANIVVNATSQPNTKCFIQMGAASKAADNSFINFVNKKEKYLSTSIPAPKTNTTANNFNVKVDLQLDVTPNAEMELIVDPKGGDMIKGNGNGNLRVSFDTFSDIKLYGTYQIENGYYLFTLQNVLRREFKIDKGSTITWTSDPYNAQVNIRALYPLTASLKDLMDADQLSSMTRTSVPVNCVLQLTENLMKPTINFDIQLPTSDEGVKQQVRSIINTEEMMNRQIVYLLTFNKFYRPEYMNIGNSNVMSSEGLSLAVSTLSGQLNNWVSQAFNADNLSIGFDWRKTDQVNNEFQAQIAYQPNNRWLMNGNIGYRDDIALTNKFIGDIDVEYVLTESGKFRLKGYNHTVNRYQLKTNAKTTQGFGVMYKEEFANMDELFSYYWTLMMGKKETKK